MRDVGIELLGDSMVSTKLQTELTGQECPQAFLYLCLGDMSLDFVDFAGGRECRPDEDNTVVESLR